jgi:hypothetical protein
MPFCRLFMALAQGIIRNVGIHGPANVDQDLDVMFATLRAAFAGHVQIPQKSGSSS